MKVALYRVEDIPDEGTVSVDFFGREVLVFKVAGKPKAIMNACLHIGGPLSRNGDKLVCAWHGAEFACQNGQRLAGPAGRDSHLMFIPTRVEDGVLNYVWAE